VLYTLVSQEKFEVPFRRAERPLSGAGYLDCETHVVASHDNDSRMTDAIAGLNMASHRHSSERLHTRCGWLEVALEEEGVPTLMLDRFKGHVINY
jgi:hypothetical protein